MNEEQLDRTALRMAKPLGIIIAVVLSGVAVVTSATWLAERIGSGLGDSDTVSGLDIEPGLDVVVEIPEGASAATIAEILANAGVVRSATQFELAVRTTGLDQSLRAGRYELVTGMSSDDLIEVLRRGPVVTVYDVTIPEGLRISEILSRLSEASGISIEDFEAALAVREVTTALRDMGDKPTLSEWEGLLFPDTYRFSTDATAAVILNRMARTMEQRLASVDWTSFTDADFTVYEGIVIASLIESEVKVAEERVLVSSVIRNRLELGMPLQIDATVLYALNTRDPAEFDSQVGSPYNTYLHGGLPPTPISAPGLAALQAASSPADTEFLYYVLSSPDGSHTFSATLDDHNAAVTKAREEGVLP